MKWFHFILPTLLICIGCNNSNQTEKDYIKNLEEKNRLLENEISNIKNSSQDNVSDKSNSKSTGSDYFTIGSTEKEVLQVMGEPSSYTNLIDGKLMKFENSSVEFENGKVTGYRNYDNNLKVKVSK